MSDADTLVIHTDGGSRGNPGPAAYAFVIEQPGQPDFEEKVYLGSTTNNIAEYTGLVKALEFARALGGRHVVVYSDSELMVKQLNGQYKVKNEGLLPLYREAVRLRAEFDSFAIRHVRREFNKRADRLCNEALDNPSEAQSSGPLPPAAKSQPKAPPKTPPRAALQDEAVEVLARYAAAWSLGNPRRPEPAEAWQELWQLLTRAGAVREVK